MFYAKIEKKSQEKGSRHNLLLLNNLLSREIDDRWSEGYSISGSEEAKARSFHLIV